MTTNATIPSWDNGKPLVKIPVKPKSEIDAGAVQEYVAAWDSQEGIPLYYDPANPWKWDDFPSPLQFVTSENGLAWEGYSPSKKTRYSLRTSYNQTPYHQLSNTEKKYVCKSVVAIHQAMVDQAESNAGESPDFASTGPGPTDTKLPAVVTIAEAVPAPAPAPEQDMAILNQLATSTVSLMEYGQESRRLMVQGHKDSLAIHKQNSDLLKNYGGRTTFSEKDLGSTKEKVEDLEQDVGGLKDTVGGFEEKMQKNMELAILKSAKKTKKVANKMSVDLGGKPIFLDISDSDSSRVSPTGSAATASTIKSGSPSSLTTVAEDRCETLPTSSTPASAGLVAPSTTFTFNVASGSPGTGTERLGDTNMGLGGDSGPVDIGGDSKPAYNSSGNCSGSMTDAPGTDGGFNFGGNGDDASMSAGRRGFNFGGNGGAAVPAAATGGNKKTAASSLNPASGGFNFGDGGPARGGFALATSAAAGDKKTAPSLNLGGGSTLSAAQSSSGIFSKVNLTPGSCHGGWAPAESTSSATQPGSGIFGKINLVPGSGLGGADFGGLAPAESTSSPTKTGSGIFGKINLVPGSGLGGAGLGGLAPLESTSSPTQPGSGIFGKININLEPGSGLGELAPAQAELSNRMNSLGLEGDLASQSKPAPTHQYETAQVVHYTQSDGSKMFARVEKAFFDDRAVPCYTIKLASAVGGVINDTLFTTTEESLGAVDIKAEYKPNEGAAPCIVKILKNKVGVQEEEFEVQPVNGGQKFWTPVSSLIGWS